MPRGGAHFAQEELEKVLDCYDIGEIENMSPLTAGNQRAPKMVIESQRGKYLLKRRSRGKDDLYRVTFGHAVHLHLAQRGFPVSQMIETKTDKNTVLQLDHHIYELFSFIEGSRYDGSSAATHDAGRQMGRFHWLLAEFDYELLMPLRGSFHDSGGVRSHLKTIASETKAPHKPMKEIAYELMRRYEAASVRVNSAGYDTWVQQIVHGDWHPGNMLFAERKLVALLDFDSVKIAPAVTDLANGALQFSIVGGRPNPAEWPDYLDEGKLGEFVAGYREVVGLKRNQIEVLPDLMTETMIAEAVLPVATTGFFGYLEGEDFLRMICRKARWLQKNRVELGETIVERSSPTD
jgi:Ser/Thr protein kinase RdoA (MazF antagonist)